LAKIDISNAGLIDCSTDETLWKKRVVEVKNPLPKGRGARGGLTVVDDTGRKYCDCLARGITFARVEVIANRSTVDDQHSPGVVAMRRVCVIDHRGVKNLADPSDPGVPCLDPTTGGNLIDHVLNVLDSKRFSGRLSAGGSILMFEPSGTSTTGDYEGEVPDHVESAKGHQL
jgi:hypothetical protein